MITTRLFLLRRLAAMVCAATTAYLSSERCFSQGTITFDGEPLQPPGTAFYIQQYYESGVWVRPLASFGFGRIGAQPVAFRPDNGTGYLQATLGDSLMFSFTDGSIFNLDSVDLAEYSTVVPDAVTVHFVGYRPDGSVVSTDLTTDGIIDGTGPVADFQTFHFGPEFTGLSRVEIPTYGWSLDNLVVSVPEPASGSLFTLGGLLLWLMRSRSNGPHGSTQRRKDARTQGKVVALR